MSNISNDNLDNGIVVFCTNGNVMFSSNGELIENTKKARKHKNYGNVLHPPFANMLELTSSQFWVKFLNNCSKKLLLNVLKSPKVVAFGILKKSLTN